MDDARAKELLAREREHIEQAIRTAQRGGAENGGTGVEQGDFDPEDLYMGQMDAAQLAELKERLEAVERAEKRLAEGKYGLSIRSGEPIPDQRLEAFPTAELTVDEAAVAKRR